MHWSWLLLFLWIPLSGHKQPRGLWEQTFKCWLFWGHVRKFFRRVSPGVEVVVVDMECSRCMVGDLLQLCVSVTFCPYVHPLLSCPAFLCWAPCPETCPFGMRYQQDGSDPDTGIRHRGQANISTASVEILQKNEMLMLASWGPSLSRLSDSLGCAHSIGLKCGRKICNMSCKIGDLQRWQFLLLGPFPISCLTGFRIVCVYRVCRWWQDSLSWVFFINWSAWCLLSPTVSPSRQFDGNRKSPLTVLMHSYKNRSSKLMMKTSGRESFQVRWN